MIASRLRTARSYPCVLECGGSEPERSRGVALPVLVKSGKPCVGNPRNYLLRKPHHRRSFYAKPFRIRSYEKCARKSSRIRSYKNTGLKMPCFHTLTKNIGGGGPKPGARREDVGVPRISRFPQPRLRGYRRPSLLPKGGCDVL